jgi:hypothetical protein
MTSTNPARDLLMTCNRITVSLPAGDKRWSHATELQKAGFIRLKWGNGQVATLVVTDAGKNELTKG